MSESSTAVASPPTTAPPASATTNSATTTATKAQSNNSNNSSSLSWRKASSPADLNWRKSSSSGGGDSIFTQAANLHQQQQAGTKPKTPPFRKSSQQYGRSQQQQQPQQQYWQHGQQPPFQQQQQPQQRKASYPSRQTQQRQQFNQRRGSSSSNNYQSNQQQQQQPNQTSNSHQTRKESYGGYTQYQSEGTGFERRRHSTGNRNRKKPDSATGTAAVSVTNKPTRLSSARHHSSVSESNQNGSEYDYYTDEFEMEEPFSESDEDETPEEREARHKRQSKPQLLLPMPRRRIRTLSGMIPAVGYAPVWGGPTMCLNCLEFFDLPNQTAGYVQHLLDKHKIVITDIELIVDLKRYIEYWRHRFGAMPIENVFSLISPKEDDPLYGKVDNYYLMSETLPEDRQIRERLALRRLEEVLSCQQREREDRTFNRQCLFCRYKTKGNRAKLVHHLYTIHHLNLGSPDNLVFVSEYLDVLDEKLKRNECIYCEKTFPDHATLSEHMRKKQHREVNPKNNYYDKFYVINYLELGKKWLEVLEEDFEDNTPTFVDSEEEEEEESWNEWQEDNADESEVTAVCLFCDEAFQEMPKLFDHMKETHQYDLKKIISDGQLNFYERVKLVNYIRKLSHNCVCFVCGQDDLRSWPALRKHLANNDHLTATVDKDKWDKDEYLIPTYDNDNLLCFLEDVAEEEEENIVHTLETVAEAQEENVGEDQTAPRKQQKSESAAVVVIPEDPPELEDTVLNDPELREQLKS